jgi:hypothetical protein
MNSGKFASLHSNILARKGDARPWNGPIAKHGVTVDDDELPRFQPAPSTFQPTTEPLFSPAQKPAAPKPAMPAPRAAKVEAATASLATRPEPAPSFIEVKPAAVQPAPAAVDEMEFSDLSAEPTRGYDPERIKKCTIRMSFIDYERLGIIAVKRNVTRQHLLHEALERCFTLAAEEYRKDCSCLGSRESCCQG